MGSTLYRFFQIFVGAFFVIAIAVVASVDLYEHVMNPPTWSELGVACLLALIAAAFNYRHYMGPRQVVCPNGTIIEEHSDGTQVCIYQDGTRVTSRHGKFVSFESADAPREPLK